MWTSLIGFFKDPLGNIKTILAVVLITAISTYCVVLWNKNSGLVTDIANQKTALASYEKTNADLVKTLDHERAEVKRINDILAKSHEEQNAVEPIYKERIVYVQKYRDNPNIPKCNLSPEWVQGHNTAATNPYGSSSSSSASGTEPSASRSDADALEVVTENYKLYYELKHNYLKLLDVCTGATVGK